MKKSLMTAAIALAAALPLSSFAYDNGCYNSVNCKPSGHLLVTPPGYAFDGHSVGMTIPKGYYNCSVINPAKEPTDLQIAVNHKILPNKIKGNSTQPQALNKMLKGGDYLSFTQVTPKSANSVMVGRRYRLYCAVQAN